MICSRIGSACCRVPWHHDHEVVGTTTPRWVPPPHESLAPRDARWPASERVQGGIFHAVNELLWYLSVTRNTHTHTRTENRDLEI
jgi:hypothetical protein